MTMNHEEVTAATVAAYNAAHAVLARCGYPEDVRQWIAGSVAALLAELRANHGMGFMLQLAQSPGDRDDHVVRPIGRACPGMWKHPVASGFAGVSSQAIDDAVQAAARVLAEG
jgi:hypothetical protein